VTGTEPGSGPDGGIVSFTAMSEGTAEDYRLLERHEAAYAAGLADRMLAGLGALSGSLGGYRVSRLDHSLQSATRARRDGADVDWVVAALVHDIGDVLAPLNHSELAAAILRPYVPPEVHWVVLHHGIFQRHYYAHHLGGDRNERDRFRDHPWYERCVEFCERWDQPSFDPAYPSEPLDAFEADVRLVFGRTAWDPAVVGPDPGDRTA
jgi:predicted HD phosphohydrolase